MEEKFQKQLSVAQRSCCICAVFAFVLGYFVISGNAYSVTGVIGALIVTILSVIYITWILANFLVIAFPSVTYMVIRHKVLRLLLIRNVNSVLKLLESDD